VLSEITSEFLGIPDARSAIRNPGDRSAAILDAETYLKPNWAFCTILPF
jgi:hypothetical protein